MSSGNRNRNGSYKTSMEQANEIHEPQVILTDLLAQVLGVLFAASAALLALNLLWDISKWPTELKVTLYCLGFAPSILGILLLVILKKKD